MTPTRLRFSAPARQRQHAGRGAAYLIPLVALLPTACTLAPKPQACTPPAITLLGEQHDSAPDHARELATITRLAAANPTLILAAEMFPRSAQPTLDQWSAGRLTEPAFLAQSHWQTYWGFPPELYMPIWRFARDHHLPIVALNVSHALTHATAHAGWAAIPAAQREGITTPAPATPAYRATLTEALAGHPMPPDHIAHFIDAQLVWDRAMAQAIAAQHAATPQRPIVAIMGEIHLQGVPIQLQALGITGTAIGDPPASCAITLAAYAPTQ